MSGSRKLKSLNDGYTIGITIYVKPDGDLSLFENGLKQNVLFLYHLFKAAPRCRKVYLLNHGDGEAVEPAEYLGIEKGAIVRTPTVIDELDYVIGLGAAVDAGIAADLRSRGCKMVAYKGGNGAVISLEATCGQPPRGDAERYFDRDFWDAIWMTSQHIHTYKGWCETIYRCPVYDVPQVWSPLMLKSFSDEIQQRFPYARPGPKWRISSLDPNITIMKTSHMPMLVCEAAFRRRPDAFDHVFITNAFGYRDIPHFNTFVNCLSVHQKGILSIEGRFMAHDFLGNYTDAVVTHQWENGLNYLYYDVLYGDRPLIHNSPFLKDYGYYYEDFNAESGAAALLRAFDEHDQNLDAYRRNNQTLFARLDPASPANIALHEGLLEALG